ncbi:cytochrome P450 CYP749A22-like isoform X2 [Hibiscus syriacus]|uniref:cytochrome P450 CYP749A22-like isoform X2 n=1 Tax=Hibiscus syriacus TaxID=106335 RepID=UPI001920CFD9|nr:cytochrome P450 CYP749A22-like isoform X2 [Hibiscus syriacus]
MSGLMKLVIVVSCCLFLGIKGPPYRFIHGNNKQITQMKMEASTKPMGLTDDIFPMLQPHLYSWLQMYGRNFLYWNGAEAELVISEPELVKEVLINSGKAFLKRKPTDLGNKLLGTGLVMVEGEKWVKQRKLANRVFHGESLKDMNQAMIAGVETMLARWKGQEGKEMDVYQEFRLLTSEVISRTAFGSSYLEGEKIFNMLSKLSIIVIRNIFATRIPFISKLWKSTDMVEAEELEKGIQVRVMEIVKKREDKVVSGESDCFGDDFLGLLVKAYHDSDKGKRLLLQDLVGECKTFYLAGQETVNSLLGWTVLLLSIHRDWQEKARREVIEIFGDQNPHLEGIPKLKTMSMIINETLRLYGPSSGLPRQVGKEVQLGNLVLPPNMNVSVQNIALHRDPQLWGADVHLFKPQRFADGVAKATNYNAAAYFPFGLGPRSCVGMAFANTEAKIALSMILQRYTITLSPAYVHKPVILIGLQPQHGIQVILESLHNYA